MEQGELGMIDKILKMSHMDAAVRRLSALM